MEEFNALWERSQREFSRNVRPLQQREFECCAGCAQQTSLSDEQYDNCLKNCGAPVARIGEIYMREVTMFQVSGGPGHLESP